MRLDKWCAKTFDIPIRPKNNAPTVGPGIKSIPCWKVATGHACWLHFADSVNIIRSPVAEPAYSRIYWRGVYYPLAVRC